MSIWIYEGNLQIEYQEALLAQYHGDYDWHQNHLQEVSQPTLYRTPFVSPQLEMFELDDDQWVKVYQRAYHRQQKQVTRIAQQLPLASLEIAV